MSNEREEAIKRRQARKRKIRRRRIRTAFITFIILSLIVGVVLCFTVLFPIKNISASGSKLYTAEQLISSSGIKNEDNLLLVNEDKVLEKIRETLHFVDSIKIEKKLPDSLSIVATDAKEYACFKNENSYYTVSKSGYLLKSYEEIPDNTFLIVTDIEKAVLGEQIILKDSNSAELLKTMVNSLEKNGIPINYIDVSDNLNLEIKVCGRFIVNLGTHTNLEKKILHLSGMVDGIDKTKTGRINLSMWTSSKTEGSFVEGSIDETKGD